MLKAWRLALCLRIACAERQTTATYKPPSFVEALCDCGFHDLADRSPLYLLGAFQPHFRPSILRCQRTVFRLSAGSAALCRRPSPPDGLRSAHFAIGSEISIHISCVPWRGRSRRLSPSSKDTPRLSPTGCGPGEFNESWKQWHVTVGSRHASWRLPIPPCDASAEACAVRGMHGPRLSPAACRKER